MNRLAYLLVVLAMVFSTAAYAQNTKDGAAQQAGLSIDFLGFEGRHDQCFTRIRITNSSESVIAGTLKLEQRGYGSRNERASTIVANEAFSLDAGAERTFELLWMKGNEGGHRLLASIYLQSAQPIFQNDIDAQPDHWWPYFGSAENTPTIYAFQGEAENSLHALPRNPLALLIFDGMHVRLGKHASDRDLETLRVAFERGLNLHLLVSPEDEEALAQAERIVGHAFTFDQLERDSETYDTAMNKSISGAVTYPSGLQAPRGFFSSLAQASAVDYSANADRPERGRRGRRGRRESRSEAKPVEEEIEESKALMSTQARALYQFPSAAVVISVAPPEQDATTRLLQKGFNLTLLNTTVRGKGIGEPVTFFADIDRLLVMPFSLLAAFVVVLAIVLCVAPFLYFRVKRPQWLVVGVAMLAGIGALSIAIARGIAHANVPVAIECHIFDASPSGQVVAQMSSIQTRGLPLESALSADRASVFMVTSTSKLSPETEVQVADAGLSAEAEQFGETYQRALQFLRAPPAGMQDNRYGVSRSGKTITNTGNQRILGGVVGISDQTVAFIPPVDAGEAVETVSIYSPDDLDSAVAKADLSNLAIQYLLKGSYRYRSIQNHALEGVAYLVIEDPEGASPFGERDDKRSVSIVRVVATTD